MRIGSGVSVFLVLCVSVVIGCGGSGQDASIPAAETQAAVEAPQQPGDAPLAVAELRAAADANCRYLDERLGRLGPTGKTVDGINAQWASYVPVLEEFNELQSNLTADASQARAWSAYLQANREYIAAARALAKAPDQAALEAAGARRAKALAATYPPADAIGLKVCTFSPEPTVVPTEMSDAADFDLPEPRNTVDQAAQSFLAAVESGECARVNAVTNSDSGELDEGNCQFLFSQYGGTTVAGTESYGPVALAEFYNPDDGRNGTVRFIVDSDGRLKYAGEGSIIGGGIRPPSEGFDSQDSMDAALAAIREEDGEAFLAIQGPDSVITEAPDPFLGVGSEPGGEVIAQDIRDNPDAEAAMLTANQLNGFFIFDAGERKYLLENTHSPGSESSYGNFGYWLLPES